jgi:TPR repeat protein
MKWQFTLNQSLIAMRLLSQRSIFLEFGTAVIFLTVVASSAMANTPPSNEPYACSDGNVNNHSFESNKECSTLAFNVPLLDAPARSSGPEVADVDRGVISTAQKIELDRLSVLAAQAENSYKVSKPSKPEQANAAWIMGLLTLHGRGLPADVKRAKSWFQIAWQQGEKIASAGLAWCEMVGCGMPLDLAKARYWRTQLSKVNRGRALYFEWLARAKSAPLDLPNDVDAKSTIDKIPHHKLLVEAANAGDIHAHIELGIASAAKNQLDEALQHFVFAEQNSSIVSNNASHIRSEIDQEKSLSKLQESSFNNADLAESSWLQARRYHRGEGIPINYVEAIRLYRKAADLGHLHAKKMLDLIFSQSTEMGAINIFWMQRLSRMDVSGFSPQLPTVDGPVLLAREETGLTDFIPLLWMTRGVAPKANLLPCQPQISPC